jgi:hypothetical protein
MRLRAIRYRRERPPSPFVCPRAIELGTALRLPREPGSIRKITQKGSSAPAPIIRYVPFM